MISQLKEQLLRNIILRILAVVIAISIWGWVQVNEEATFVQKVSLEFILPNDLIESSQLPKTILVEVSGSKGLIKSLENMTLSTQLDLSDGVLGGNHIDLSTQSILGLPEGVSISRYTPPSIGVNLDQQMLRELPIHPNIVGSPKDNWQLEKIEVHPRTITIKGPRKLLTSLSEIQTKVIDINKISSSMEVQVGLSFSSSMISSENNDNISISILVQQVLEEKLYSAIPISLKGNSSLITPNTVDITLQLPKNEIDNNPTFALVVDPLILEKFPSKFEFSPLTKEYFSVRGLSNEMLDIIAIQPTEFTITKGPEE